MIKYYIIVGGIILNLKISLNIKIKGEAFIYIKFFLIIKKHLGVSSFKFKKDGINISKHNN